MLATAYFVVGRLGLLIPIAQEHVTLLWAPTGIALAAVLRFGHAAVPGIALGAFLVNLTVGGSPGLALSIAAGNTLEAVVGAWLLRRSGFRPSLERVRDVLLFIVLGVLAAPMVSATIGAASLAAFGQVPPDQDVSNLGSFWWLGDAMGALLVAPLLLTWMELPVKFTPAGGTVTVRSWKEGEDRLVLQVSDTGVGIDPEVLPHVFDAFEQGRERSPRNVHRVTTAGTVAAALDTFRRERFDLLLSDLGLPDGSGLDVMREISSRNGGIPGIALSGYGMEEDVRRSHEAGFSKHLTKPVSLPALETAIRQTVREKVEKR